LKILRRKVLKLLPVWFLALILVGSAAAAFIWISNMRITWVNVREYPITLTGDFDNATYQYETTYQYFDYTVNDASNSTGYVLLQFTTSSSLDTLNPGDIEVYLVVSLGGVDQQEGYDMPGYPNSTYVNQLTFLFCDYAGSPFDFDLGGSSGWIDVTITYNVAYSDIAAGIRITSSS
jgi:hypothetical protein